MKYEIDDIKVSFEFSYDDPLENKRVYVFKGSLSSGHVTCILKTSSDDTILPREVHLYNVNWTEVYVFNQDGEKVYMYCT